MEPEDRVSAIPLFPLPNVVLFPHTVLPLHIFEPRYKAMMKSALAGDKRIGMALLKPGWEEDDQGAPPVFDIVGVGRILQHEELEDGRYNLMLAGIGRGRIVEVRLEEPFRVALVEPLEEIERASEALERKRRDLIERFASMLQPLKKDPMELPLSLVTDLLGAAFVEDPLDKQELLATLDVEERHDKLVRILSRRRKPPEPSLN